MSNRRTRTTPYSPVEKTEPKRRAIDPKEQKSFDWNDALFEDIPPPPPSPIARLFPHKTIEFLAKEVEKTPELVQRAKDVVAEIPECGDKEGVQKFSIVVRETWPLLASAIKKTMYSAVGDLVGLVKRYANRDSATQRWAHMKADPSFGSAASTENDILRFFLSILIGYWGDRAELPKLDKAFRFPLSDDTSYVSPVKKLSYEIKSADSKNLERVRKWLVTQYGNDKNVDVDDLFERIKSVLLSHVKIGEECGAMRVDVRVINSWSFLAVLESC